MMATTARTRRRPRASGPAWRRLPDGSLAEGDQRPRLHPAELRAVRRRRVVPRARDRRARSGSGTRLNELFVEERKKGVLDVSQIPELDHRARPRLHRPRATRSSSACRPTRRSSARSCRTAASGWSLSALKTYGYEPDPHVVETFTKYRKTHNDGGLRRLHRRHPALPQLAHPDRAARRLRPRPHHRRLPARRALRRRRG